MAIVAGRLIFLHISLICSDSAIAHSKAAFSEWQSVSAWERKALLVNVSLEEAGRGYRSLDCPS